MDTLPQMRSHAEGAAFGEFLRRARERRGLTLQQISNETKIPQRHLDALEHGNLSAIPHDVYRRAEIRAFAQTVGLDQKLALAELERALEASAQVQAARPATQPPGESRRSREGVAIGIAIFLIAAVWGLAVLNWKPAQRREAPAAVAAAHDAANAAAPASQQTREVIVEPRERDVANQAAQPPEVVEGQLVVTTEPAGARVTVNGVGWGATPITIRHLPLGETRIRVTKEGYAGAERLVPLAEDRPAREIHIPLRVRQ